MRVVWAQCEFTCAADSGKKIIGGENETLNSQAQTRGLTPSAICLLSGSIKGSQKTEGRGLLQCQKKNQIYLIPTIYYKIVTGSFKARMKIVVQMHGWKTNC